jgi:hypothetical protein
LTAQINPTKPDEDESMLYASTKQVNQFIRRFNGEEDLKGNRLYPKDKKYRDQSLRKKYLSDIIDLENSELKNKLPEFITYVNSGTKPQYFDFYGKNWFAEVASKFLYNGKEQNVVLFFKLEEENFMTLRKAFKNNTQIEHYAQKNFSPDYLTLFFYYVKKGNLVFQQVDDVKFHIFQIENLYFEMQYFNRKGDNTGWLISNLIQIPEKDKASLIKSIYHEK